MPIPLSFDQPILDRSRRGGACPARIDMLAAVLGATARPRGNGRRLAIRIVLTALLVLASTGSLTSCQQHEVAPPGDQVQDLKVVPVARKTLNRIDQFPGEIQAYQDVAIYPKVPGFVKWIGVDRGSIVKKGQLMIGIFAPEFLAQRNEAYEKVDSVNAQFHETESKLATARAKVLEVTAKMQGDDDTYERTKEASLVPGVVAPNDLIILQKTVEADKQLIQAWQDNVRAATNQVKSLQESLKSAQKAADSYKDIADYLIIAAPFDGYITERNMHVGSFCGPLGKGAYPPIVRIQQLNLLRIVTPVPEVDAGGVLPGAPVDFTVSTHPGERFVGTVARIGYYLEQRTRTMPVELNYWNHGLRVLPGMFCEVYWPTRRQNPTLFVPVSAVVTTSTLETFVCRVNRPQNIIEWVKVKKGQTMDQLTEIFGDIKEGDLVALIGTDELQPGTRVNPVLVSKEESERPPVPRPAYHPGAPPISIPESEREHPHEVVSPGSSETMPVGKKSQ